MIVKNEAPLIANALRSVKPHIHAWAIVDTGSTDGTQDVIQKELANLPGKLEERKWVDFSTNRNQALDLALEQLKRLHENSLNILATSTKQEEDSYVLVLDADDVMEFSESFDWPKNPGSAGTAGTGYNIEHVLGVTHYMRPQLVSTKHPWRYAGPTHEVLVLPNGVGADQNLEGVVTRCNVGDRSYKPSRSKRDIDTLEAALKKEPNHSRYTFYLAQSYRDHGDVDRALKYYRKRAEMGGWAQETYCARLEVGKLLEHKKNRTGALAEYLFAYDLCPDRAEALCKAATVARLMERYNLAYLMAKKATELPQPKDALFIDEGVYAWHALDELSLAAFYSNRRSEALAIMKKLCELAPEEQQPRMQANLGFFTPDELSPSDATNTETPSGTLGEIPAKPG